MGRRLRRGGRARRSVAWIDGVTSFQTGGGGTGVTYSVLTFVQPNVAIAPLVWGVATIMTTAADLSMHGGEDAVLTRVRGRLGFFSGARNAGAGLLAGTFFARVAVVLSEVNPTNQTFPVDLTTSAGLGRDNILWMRDIFVLGAVADQADVAGITQTNVSMFDVDVRAQRKLTSNEQAFLWIQTSGVAGTTGFECRLYGGLRMLLKRPR